MEISYVSPALGWGHRAGAKGHEIFIFFPTRDKYQPLHLC